MVLRFTACRPGLAAGLPGSRRSRARSRERSARESRSCSTATTTCPGPSASSRTRRATLTPTTSAKGAGRRADRHPAPARRRRRRRVLVRVHAGRGGRRLRAHAARADRHRAPADRALSRHVHAGVHRGRHPRGQGGRQDRRHAGRGGRSRDRGFPRRAAHVLRPRRALHDAHAQQPHRLGRFRDGFIAGPRRPHRVRRAGRARDEPRRDAHRPLAHGAGHHARRDSRVEGAGDLLAFLGTGAVRHPAQRAG